MKKFVLVVASLASISTPASAMTYFLQSDLGVQNNQHLCRYSNNRTYAYNATDLCPLSVDDDMPAATSGSYGQAPTYITGFLQGEYQDGMTKVCVYSVLGNKEAIRIGAVEICPQTQAFQQ
jgi:hypothetical protein